MIMMKIMIMMKRMMIMKGGREGTPGGGAGAGRGSSAGPRWAADFGMKFAASLHHARVRVGWPC